MSYQHPVNGMAPTELARRLRKAIARVEKEMPARTGVTLFVFDFGEGGGLGYISNAQRADMIATVKEWIAKQERLP